MTVRAMTPPMFEVSCFHYVGEGEARASRRLIRLARKFCAGSELVLLSGVYVGRRSVGGVLVLSRAWFYARPLAELTRR